MELIGFLHSEARMVKEFLQRYLTPLDVLLLRCVSKEIQKRVLGLVPDGVTHMKGKLLAACAEQGSLCVLEWLLFEQKVGPRKLRARVLVLQKAAAQHGAWCVLERGASLAGAQFKRTTEERREILMCALEHGQAELLRMLKLSIPDLTWPLTTRMMQHGQSYVFDFVFDELGWAPNATEASRLWWDAACAANFESLEYLYARLDRVPWDEKTMLGPIKQGHLRCLQWLRDHGCPWSSDACSRAVQFGQIECLRFFHVHGCKWTLDLCNTAVCKGNLACLQYARERIGCPWDERTCAWAAGNGHADCLRYLHENGCPWDWYTCFSAACTGQLECLRYACENGCDFDERCTLQAATGSHLETLTYLVQIGCPFSEDARKIARKKFGEMWKKRCWGSANDVSLLCVPGGAMPNSWRSLRIRHTSTSVIYETIVREGSDALRVLARFVRLNYFPQVYPSLCFEVGARFWFVFQARPFVDLCLVKRMSLQNAWAYVVETIDCVREVHRTLGAPYGYARPELLRVSTTNWHLVLHPPFPHERGNRCSLAQDCRDLQNVVAWFLRPNVVETEEWSPKLHKLLSTSVRCNLFEMLLLNKFVFKLPKDVLWLIFKFLVRDQQLSGLTEIFDVLGSCPNLSDSAFVKRLKFADVAESLTPVHFDNDSTFSDAIFISEA